MPEPKKRTARLNKDEHRAQVVHYTADDTRHDVIREELKERRGRDEPPEQMSEVAKTFAVASTDTPEWLAVEAARHAQAVFNKKAPLLKAAAEARFDETLSQEDSDAITSLETWIERKSFKLAQRVRFTTSDWTRCEAARKTEAELAENLKRLKSGAPLDKTQNQWGTYAEPFLQSNPKFGSIHDLTFYLLAHQARETERMPTDREIAETNEDVLSSIARLKKENGDRVSFRASPDCDQVPESSLRDFVHEENRCPTNDDIIGGFRAGTIQDKKNAELKIVREREHASQQKHLAALKTRGGILAKLEAQRAAK